MFKGLDCLLLTSTGVDDMDDAMIPLSAAKGVLAFLNEGSI